MKTISLELIDYNIQKINENWWNQIMSLFLNPGQEFEIRHWKEDKETVNKASAYGMISEIDCTDFEVSVKGVLTTSTIDVILNSSPLNKDNLPTEFFTINVSNAISSSHYGKEVYIFNPTELKQKQLQKIIEPIEKYFTFAEYCE